MREWVVGFLFDEDAYYVMLIRKNRPAWQAGKLNGIGGKVEQGENPSEAMVREFQEETGVTIRGWDHFLDLQWEEGLVHFFRAFRPREHLERCRTTTDESVERHVVHRLNEPGDGLLCVTPNIQWLVPLAAHQHDTYQPITVVEKSTTLRKTGRGK